MCRKRHVRKANITRCVGIASNNAREALLLGDLGRSWIMEERKA
jgi:hypothetical protein